MIRISLFEVEGLQMTKGRKLKGSAKRKINSVETESRLGAHVLPWPLQIPRCQIGSKPVRGLEPF